MAFSPQLTAACAVALPATLLAWRLGGSLLGNFFTRKYTVLYDLDNLGPAHARPEGKRLRGTAVISGGSLAGLWSALVVADHFENVIIVESEAWTFSEEGISNAYDEKGVFVENSRQSMRSRVMQYTADHAFQPIALDALRKYFPNFDEEVRRAQGCISEYEINLHSYGHKVMELPRREYPDGKYPESFFMSREAYERLLRRLVLGYSDRIHTKVGTATALNTVPGDPMSIASVTVRSPDGTTEEISASLVIDCTGGTQAGLKWLRRIATDPTNAAPLQRFVPPGALSWDDVRMEYNTCQKYIRYRFHVPPEDRARLPIPGGYDNVPWMYTYIPVPRTESKMFMINRIEGHRIEMSFGGWGSPPLPMEMSEIKDWFKGLEVDHQKVPDWFYPFLDILIEHPETCERSAGTYPNLSWIRYEQAPYISHNFIAIGDSVMFANPSYGQGCAKATVGAISLDAVLKTARYADATKIPPCFGRDFFVMHKDKIQGVWDGTKPKDYQWDTTTPCKGEKNSDEWFSGGLDSILTEMAGLDKEIDSVLYKVHCFMAPPIAMLSPYFLTKIAWFVVKKKLGLIRP